MSEVKALFFDMDGLVIDSESYYDKATTQMLASMGIEYDRDGLKPQLSGKPSIECMQFLVEHYGLDITAEELDDKRRDFISNVYGNEIPFIEGFLDFYKNLRKAFNVPVALVTGCDRKFFALIDERLNMTELFDGNVYMTDSDKFKNSGYRSKPAPDIFDYAASHLEISAENCIVFEDAPNGIVSAIRAGVPKVVVLTRTFTREIISKQCKEFGYELNDGGNVLFINNYSDDSLKKASQYISI